MHTYHVSGTSLGKIQETVKETITKQNVDFNLYDNENNKIAYLSYYLENASTIYLSYIKIYDRNNRGNSLGKQLFTYFINHVKERNPTIKTIKWQAVTLDEEHMSQKKLETWYTARGGINMGPYPNGNGTLFKLYVNEFKPEHNLSSVLALDIKENFRIKGKTEIELKNTLDRPIAKLCFLLSVSNNKYSLRIDGLNINPAYRKHNYEIKRTLQCMVIKHMRAKEWLEDRTATIKTNGILPTFII